MTKYGKDSETGLKILIRLMVHCLGDSCICDLTHVAKFELLNVQHIFVCVNWIF